MTETTEDLCRRLAGLMDGWEYLPGSYDMLEAPPMFGKTGTRLIQVVPAPDAPLPEKLAFVGWCIRVVAAARPEMARWDIELGLSAKDGSCLYGKVESWGDGIDTDGGSDDDDIVTAALMAAIEALEA